MCCSRESSIPVLSYLSLTFIRVASNITTNRSTSNVFIYLLMLIDVESIVIITISLFFYWSFALFLLMYVCMYVNNSFGLLISPMLVQLTSKQPHANAPIRRTDRDAAANRSMAKNLERLGAGSYDRIRLVQRLGWQGWRTAASMWVDSNITALTDFTSATNSITR